MLTEQKLKEQLNKLDIIEIIPYKYNNENNYNGYFQRYNNYFGKYPLNKEIMIKITEEGYFNHINNYFSLIEIIIEGYKDNNLLN